MTPGIHQVLGGAAPWDAITNHALAAQKVIRGMGYRSEIFADREHIAHAIRNAVRPHGSWSRVAQARDAALLQYSIESPAFDAAIRQASQVAIVYHNVTPPNLLWRDAPGIALQCRSGLEGLRALIPHVHHAAAVSRFNAGELVAAGFREPTVTGILRRDLPRAPQMKRPSDAVRLLFVGRGIPNKRQDALILALAAIRETGVDAELRLVGGWGACRPFLERCRRLGRELDLRDRVAFLGPVDDQALAQEYADADVFVCLSQHEGYCVPIIEAMANDLPVVALRAGAVSETLAGAGILVDDLQPSSVAEATLLALDPTVQAQFAQARATQLAHHSRQATTERLERFVREVASAC